MLGKALLILTGESSTETPAILAPVASEATRKAQIDVALVIDTSNTMTDALSEIRSTAVGSLMERLSSTAASYRVAVVSYRGLSSSQCGSNRGYLARVEQSFTSNAAAVTAAIHAMPVAQVECESGNATVFSGIKEALNLPWSPAVTKSMIVIGAAPVSLKEGTGDEYQSGITAESLFAANLAIDAQISVIDAGLFNQGGRMDLLAASTGGTIIRETTAISDAITSIIDASLAKPIAWMRPAFKGVVGRPVALNALGSFDPKYKGSIVSYEWDFDDDGNYDAKTSDGGPTTVHHKYSHPYKGTLRLRVRNELGWTATRTAHVDIRAPPSE